MRPIGIAGSQDAWMHQSPLISAVPSLLGSSPGRSWRFGPSWFSRIWCLSLLSLAASNQTAAVCPRPSGPLSWVAVESGPLSIVYLIKTPGAFPPHFLSASPPALLFSPFPPRLPKQATLLLSTPSPTSRWPDLTPFSPPTSPATTTETASPDTSLSGTSLPIIAASLFQERV